MMIGQNIGALPKWIQVEIILLVKMSLDIVQKIAHFLIMMAFQIKVCLAGDIQYK